MLLKKNNIGKVAGRFKEIKKIKKGEYMLALGK